VEAVIADIEATGRRALYFNINAADPKKRTEALDEVQKEMGDAKVGVMVHSLAFGALLPYFDDDPAKCINQKRMEMTLDVMANSLVYWAQDVYWRGMFAEDARIFAMTSEGNQRIFPNYGAVSAAKAALDSHVRQIAYELAKQGIRCNSIQAGVTETPALKAIPGSEVMLEVGARRNPFGRITTPKDVADAVVNLSRPGCAWITGSVINVDGGESIIP
jgi:enoyl-[acyl-carrier-protein] reductase (NADH)